MLRHLLTKKKWQILFKNFENQYILAWDEKTCAWNLTDVKIVTISGKKIKISHQQHIILNHISMNENEKFVLRGGKGGVGGVGGLRSVSASQSRSSDWVSLFFTLT